MNFRARQKLLFNKYIIVVSGNKAIYNGITEYNAGLLGQEAKEFQGLLPLEIIDVAIIYSRKVLLLTYLLYNVSKCYK